VTEPRGKVSSELALGIAANRRGLGVSWMDVKLGIRMLKKEPLLTAVALLTLAIGIPTSLFPTHVLGLFESTFPVEDGARIVGIRNWDLETNRPSQRPLHDFAVWRAELTSFESVAAARSDPWNVHSPDGRAAEIRGAQVSASVFTMLRVRPLLGRPLLKSDEVEGAPDVVVIREDVWRSRFGRDPDIIGKSIGIGRTPHTVVGVMPEDFAFPVSDHLWLPLRMNPNDYAVGAGPDLFVFGRLAEGVSHEEADAEVAVVGSRLAAEWPETHARLRPEVVGSLLLLMGEPASGLSDSREILLVQAFALLLLFIACGNVGTMILARTATRVRELAVRTALGATRARIVTQLFVESLVLALVATSIGLVLADQVARQIASMYIEDIPYGVDIGIGLRSISIALGLGTVCAVAAGVLPALRATGRGIQRTIQSTAAGATVRFGMFTTVLIVLEVALSMGFLSMGVVVTRSVLLNSDDPSEIAMDQYLTARFRTVWVDPTAEDAATYEEDFWTQVALNQEELKLRLQAEPGVGRVAMGAQIPGAGHPSRPVEVEGDVPGDGAGMRVQQANVDVTFFTDMHHPILEGRGFGSGDLPDERNAHRAAVIVNTSFVEQVLGGGQAVGRRIRYLVGGDQEPGEWYEIVGVVGSLAMNPSNPAEDAGVYHPLGANEYHPMRYVIEVGPDAGAFLPRLTSIAAAVDPDAMIQAPQVLADLAELSRLELRLASLLVVGLSLIGTLLAAAGLYALMSFTVSQRTREIGIRSALGARAMSVIVTIARRAALQLGTGVVGGCVFGAWLLRDLTNDSDIMDVNTPAVLAGVGVAVILMVTLACLAPIRRGLRIEPTEALRE